MPTTVTGLTADRMQEIIDDTINDAHITADHLILEKAGGGTVDVGNVRGPQGDPGVGIVICTSSTRPDLSFGDTGTIIFETDTSMHRVWLGSLWRSLSLGLLDEVSFGSVNVSVPNNDFASLTLVTGDVSNIAVDYLFAGSKITSNGDVVVELAVTGQSNRRVFRRLGMVTGDTFTDNGNPVSGRQVYKDFPGGIFTVELKVTTISSGAIRTDSAWHNQLSVFDLGGVLTAP